jgi:hypothetical protein
VSGCTCSRPGGWGCQYKPLCEPGLWFEAAHLLEHLVDLLRPEPGRQPRPPKAVKHGALALEPLQHVLRADHRLARVLGAGDGVAEHALEVGRQDAVALLEAERGALVLGGETRLAHKRGQHRLGHALDVVAERVVAKAAPASQLLRSRFESVSRLPILLRAPAVAVELRPRQPAAVGAAARGQRRRHLLAGPRLPVVNVPVHGSPNVPDGVCSLCGTVANLAAGGVVAVARPVSARRRDQAEMFGEHLRVELEAEAGAATRCQHSITSH